MGSTWTLEDGAHGDGQWFVSIGRADVRVIAPPGVLIQRSERQTGAVGWRVGRWIGDARLGRHKPTTIEQVDIELVLKCLPAAYHADVRRLIKGQLSAVRSRAVDADEVAEDQLASDTASLKDQLEAATPSSGAQAHAEVARPARGSYPTPAAFGRIGLVASAGLRQGPTSPLAQLLRELSPYLMQHRPHIYALEGAYRTILTTGLLRSYPIDRLHCLAPGRLGGMVDIGAGLVGSDATGLEAAFGDKHAAVADALDLDYELDCLIYLIDPMVATSALPATLTVKRECAHRQKPLFDSVPSAVEWFALMGRVAGGQLVQEHLLDPDLQEALGYSSFPHRAIALVAVHTKKAEMLEFTSQHLDFLERFDSRFATATTAGLLNRPQEADGLDDKLNDDQRKQLTAAKRALREALDEKGLVEPWVEELQAGTSGGYLQVADALAMGLADSTIFLRDPKAADTQDGAELLDRVPLVSNYSVRPSDASGQMFLRDATSAAAWAALWTALPEDASPTTLTAAFRERLGVQLVLADARDTDREQWDAIAEEAAWFLVSAIASTRSHGRRGGTEQRVTVACGSAMQKVVSNIRDPVAFDLADRIDAHRRRHDEAVATCKRLVAGKERAIDHIAGRKRLTLQASSTNVAALWSIGSVTVAPMVGVFGSTRRSVEANHNAHLLAQLVEGGSLSLATTAYVSGPSEVPDEIARHWATTDFLLMACDDLAVSWFGGKAGKVRLPRKMFQNLWRKRAVGEIAGLYLDADGHQVLPDEYVRQGMGLADMQRVASAADGGAAIMIAGAHTPDADGRTRRVATVLAALRARAVSVLVTDARFATALLHASVADAEDG